MLKHECHPLPCRRCAEPSIYLPYYIAGGDIADLVNISPGVDTEVAITLTLTARRQAAITSVSELLILSGTNNRPHILLSSFPLPNRWKRLVALEFNPIGTRFKPTLLTLRTSYHGFSLSSNRVCGESVIFGEILTASSATSCRTSPC